MHELFYFYVVYSKPNAGFERPSITLDIFLQRLDIPSFQSAAQSSEPKANGLIIV